MHYGRCSHLDDPRQTEVLEAVGVALVQIPGQQARESGHHAGHAIGEEQLQRQQVNPALFGQVHAQNGVLRGVQLRDVPCDRRVLGQF